ncbi:MAG: hypothetical protein HYY02_03230 [Chloroflexi bacterium]|nr:hypothetical protein [Chloroflexota bacterium]
MSEPMVVLPDGRIIDDCKWMLRNFVEFDAYVGYDHASRVLPSDMITDEHIRLINSVMMARSSRSAWKGFVRKPLPELAQIPPDADLIDGSAADLYTAMQALQSLVWRISSEKWLTDMAASKVLYLLRPKFVAISDSYVRTCLGLPSTEIWPGPNKGDECATRMLAVEKAMRELGDHNRDSLQELYEFTNSLPPVIPSKGPFRGKSVPVVLSKLRVLDILLWMEVAIHGPKPHQRWSARYHQEVRNQ